MARITPLGRRRGATAALTGVTDYEVYTERHLDRIEPLARLSDEERFAMQVVAQVLPFRVNRYVIEELVDWSAAPDDPIYRLVFPQRGMLDAGDFERMAALLRSGADQQAQRQREQQIQDDFHGAKVNRAE